VEEPSTVLTDAVLRPPGSESFDRLMLLDMLSYLPDDILVKVDRASMAVSLEARVPFLDHRVVEWAWQLPVSMKVRRGQGKWILRQVLNRYVPPALVERPKMGFGVPIDRWLRDDLRDWADAFLDEKRLAEEGFFNVELVRAKWREHRSGAGNWHYYLWPILMFQGWFERERHAYPLGTRADAAAGCGGVAHRHAA
jgi:asparagine synthase (glutamine-hydrolysing)